MQSTVKMTSYGDNQIHHVVLTHNNKVTHYTYFNAFY